MAKESNYSNATFLSINKDGYLYEKSKEPKEGYDEITLDSGAKTYHKTYKETDDGHLDFISIDKRDFSTGEVEVVSLTIKSKEGADKISFQLFKPKGGLSDYAKGLALVLPNLDYNRLVNISPSKKKVLSEKDGNKYLNRFLFFNYVDGDEPKYPEFAHKFKTKNHPDGDIPSGVTESKMGKDVWNFEKQDEYLYKILLDEIERFKQFKGSNSTKNNEPEVKKEVAQNVDNSGAEPDDLPF